MTECHWITRSLEGEFAHAAALPLHTGAIHYLRFIDQGRRLVSGAADGWLHVTDLTKGEIEFSVDRRADRWSEFLVSLDGGRALAGGEVWDLKSRSRIFKIDENIVTADTQLNRVVTMSRSESGDGDYFGLIDATTGRRICSLKGEQPKGCDAAFSQDGGFFISSEYGDSDEDTSVVRIWSAEDGTLINTVPVPAYYCDILSFDPNSNLIVVEDNEEALLVVNADGGDVLWRQSLGYRRMRLRISRCIRAT